MELEQLRARQSEIQLNRAMLDREEASIVAQISRFILDSEMAAQGVALDVETIALDINGQ